MNTSRQARLLLLLAAASLISPAPGCSGDDSPVVSETFAMGTRCVISIYGMDEDRAVKASADAFRELHRIEGLLSNWREESEVSRLNASPGGHPVTVSGELFGILEASMRYSALTAGAFDVTARPVVRLWGLQRMSGEKGRVSVPGDPEIAEALRRCGYSRVTLDGSGRSVTLPPGMEIDLAGIGKGYGVDKCVEVLRDAGVTSALVDISGNMFAIGTPPGREGWSIGIRDPRGGRGIVGKTLISGEGIATSGNYENFVVIGGKSYGHIVDPRTGRTVDHVLSVTVVAPSAMEADALSTGLFVLGPGESRLLLEELPGVRAVFAMEDDSFEFMGSRAWELETD